jgi:hypothetical protein
MVIMFRPFRRAKLFRFRSAFMCIRSLACCRKRRLLAQVAYAFFALHITGISTSIYDARDWLLSAATVRTLTGASHLFQGEVYAYENLYKCEGCPMQVVAVAGKSCNLLLLVAVVNLQVLAQKTLVPNDGNGAGRVAADFSSEPGAELGHQTYDEDPSSPSSPTKSSKNPYSWDIAIYPAMAWAPIFGASLTLPPVPSLPGTPGTPGPSGSTSGSFNGAFFGGARLEKGKWSADAMFMWTALSGEHTRPLVKINLDFIFGDAMGGREVLPNLYLEGGARRLALDFTATVGSHSASRSPGFWDPLVGLTYRRQLGRKWRILIHGDGGGFGVGSDDDVAVTGRAEWQFAHHFGLTMGYGVLHFTESDTVAKQTVTLSPTLNGPIFGFGIFF